MNECKHHHGPEEFINERKRKEGGESANYNYLDYAILASNLQTCYPKSYLSKMKIIRALFRVVSRHTTNHTLTYFFIQANY